MKLKHTRKKRRLRIFTIAVIMFPLILYYNGFSDLIINPEFHDGQIKIACVGDSITYGFGIKNQPDNSYPNILAEKLGNNCNVCNFGNIRVTVQSDGDQPFTETYTYSDSVEYGADVLIFMMGSNDAKTCNWQNEEKFTEDYLSLIDSYIVSDEKPVVFLCTPAAALYPEGKSDGTTTYTIQPEVVDRISEIVRSIAEERGYTLIDINEITKGHSEYYAHDLVHLNSEGAKAVADEVYRVLMDYKANQL